MDSKSEVKHEGISLSMEGNVTMQLSPKNVGILEAFYNSAKVNFLLYILILFLLHILILFLLHILNNFDFASLRRWKKLIS